MTSSCNAALPDGVGWLWHDYVIWYIVHWWLVDSPHNGPDTPFWPTRYVERRWSQVVWDSLTFMWPTSTQRCGPEWVGSWVGDEDGVGQKTDTLFSMSDHWKVVILTKLSTLVAEKECRWSQCRQFRQNCDASIFMIKYTPGFIVLCLSGFSDHSMYVPANERRRYNVTSSLIGSAHTQKEPRCYIISSGGFVWYIDQNCQYGCWVSIN